MPRNEKPPHHHTTTLLCAASLLATAALTFAGTPIASKKEVKPVADEDIVVHPVTSPYQQAVRCRWRAA